jgi:hypothetical protein
MLQEWGIFLCHLLNFIDVAKNVNFDGFLQNIRILFPFFCVFD